MLILLLLLLVLLRAAKLSHKWCDDTIHRLVPSHQLGHQRHTSNAVAQHHEEFSSPRRSNSISVREENVIKIVAACNDGERRDEERYSISYISSPS